MARHGFGQVGSRILDSICINTGPSQEALLDDVLGIRNCSRDFVGNGEKQGTVFLENSCGSHGLTWLLPAGGPWASCTNRSGEARP